MPGTILFVSHDAFRAGAQIALLNILTSLRTQRPDDLRVLLLGGGELVAEYERLALTYRLDTPVPRDGPVARMIRRFRVMPWSPGGRIPSELRRAPVDVVYLNTVAVAHLAKELKTAWRAPVLLQMRELEMSVQAYCGSDRLRSALEHIDGCIVGTRAVERLLTERYGVPRERVNRVSLEIVLPTPGKASSLEARLALRAELGLPREAFVVGACGTLNWWKAPELFVLAAKEFCTRRPNACVRFVWVGGHPESAPYARLQHDVDRLGLNATVSFVGAQVDPHRYFSIFDSFLLTSREDTYPFACIEAAALGVPIVCFDGSGGTPEFVETDAGFVVPYLDLAAVVERLAILMDDPELRCRLGRQAAQKARARHTRERAGPELWAVLDHYMGR